MLELKRIFGAYEMCPIGKIGAEPKVLWGFAAIMDVDFWFDFSRLFARFSSEKLPLVRHFPMLCLKNNVKVKLLH